MTVFLVSSGTLHEGGSVDAVFSTHAAAVRMVEAKIASPDIPFFGSWGKVETNEDLWIGGCDYIEIREWDVDRSEP